MSRITDTDTDGCPDSLYEVVLKHDEVRKHMDSILDSFLSGELGEEAAVYGVTMRMGPDGIPHVREFGNTSPRENVREPLTDVIEEPELIRIIVELPGVRKEGIDLRVNEASVDVDVDEEGRRYSKRVPLPTGIDPSTARANYNNGVLEVTAKRSAGQERSRSVTIE